jgi:hypothetical protein
MSGTSRSPATGGRGKAAALSIFILILIFIIKSPRDDEDDEAATSPKAFLPRAGALSSAPCPNPWTGKGNPYTRQEVRNRLQAALDRGEPIIAAGAGTGISAKFIEKGGADLSTIYNSGRFRMAGHGSTCGLMAYGGANQVRWTSANTKCCGTAPLSRSFSCCDRARKRVAPYARRRRTPHRPTRIDFSPASPQPKAGKN